MKVFEANIAPEVCHYLGELLKNVSSHESANRELYSGFGITKFFENEHEYEVLRQSIAEPHNVVQESDRAEYGDFQTNYELANKVTRHLVEKGVSPEIVVEPTCGKGNFIIATLQNFKRIQRVIGVEIYRPYVWEAKFNVIQFYLNNPTANKATISIYHCNVFDFDFKQIAREHPTEKILIMGNPPWVTNSKLGSLNSSNLPKKKNFKNHSGLDAMTGKANFDIGESITLTLMDTFQEASGHLVLLVKNSVIKNIVFDQRKAQFKISSLEKLCIDSKKEFGVSVEASIFYCQLNSTPSFDCAEFNFYDNKPCYLRFGWFGDKYVSNIEAYSHTKDIDGECPFVWRQGLKHDCSSVMELERVNGHYVNGLNEEVKLEDGLVYGLLKSSDLKNTVVTQTRKFTIVTQKRVGEETKYIKTEYPKTYHYLFEHQALFSSRKSSIYNNKPLFSIFGIGDYSFKPFKVAISGLYKTFHFTLILPQEDKPVMLDDTCYLLSFDRIDFAVYSLILLNSHKAIEFLQSVTFADAKRTFTKDVLMRINLLALARNISNAELQKQINIVNERYDFKITLDSWDGFVKGMDTTCYGQIKMFG